MTTSAKFALIKGDQTIATFASYAQAVQEGYERFGLDPLAFTVTSVSRSTEYVKTITLPKSVGTITLSVSSNVFDLAADERDLVFRLIDEVKSFERLVNRDAPPI